MLSIDLVCRVLAIPAVHGDAGAVGGDPLLVDLDVDGVSGQMELTALPDRAGEDGLAGGDEARVVRRW